MTGIIAPTVKINRGTPRIWLEGENLRRGNFGPEVRYNIVRKGATVILQVCKDGKRKVTGYLNKPIIDLCSKEVGEWFPVGTKLKAVVRRGRIVISRLVIAAKAMKRDRDLLDKLAKGEPLDMVSMFHGGGTISRALHDGFALAGIKTRIMLAAEIDTRFMDASLKANPDLFDRNSVIVNAPVQDMDFDKVPTCNVIEIGLPCLGMSKAGRVKGKLSSAEDHPTAGAMFFTMLEWVKRFQPAATIIECTKELLTSPSLSVIRSVLLSWKYDLFEMKVNGCEFGSLENRDRAVVVAMSSDLATAGGFSTADIVPLRTKPDTLADIMEPIGDDDERWVIRKGLEDKEARDKAKGNGFARQHYTGEDTYINTLRGGYAKIGSSDPEFKHPNKPRYTRMVTTTEHNRIKGMPEGWIELCDVAESVGHQILGQGGVYPKFLSVGAGIGFNFKKLAETLRPTVNVKAPASNDELTQALAV